MYEVFEQSDANWRGVGVVPESGLVIREKYSAHNAEREFQIPFQGEAVEPKGCICGDIIRGAAIPLECKMFRKVCTPERPVGPCMVSSEGTCAAYYHYGDSDE
jgi:hydrogenase expression/formation protein HypD